MQRLFSMIWAFFAGMTAVSTGEIPVDKLNYFEKHIRPAFIKYCYECHSREMGKTRGGLLVDTREGLLQGGDSGPALDLNDLSKSLLLDAVTWADPDYEMPPKNKMPEEVIAHFEKWIAMGAPDPRVREVVKVESNIDIEAGKEHWAFQRVERQPGESIDTLVGKKLQLEKLTPTPAADPFTLLRRMHIDLIGLPPTPEEIKEFAMAWKKNRDAAIREKVDDLLAREQYGERWGRYWLDLARYAESTGNVNYSYPEAWRYRDYVIDAFNKDKPYNRFIQEQLAGDVLPAKNEAGWQEALIATSFLAVGVKNVNETNPRQFRMDIVDDQIDVTARAFLGLTVSCARCHDHKSDPIPTTDYYALAGIFLSTRTHYGTVSAGQNRRPSTLLQLPIPTESVTQSYSEAEVSRMREELEEHRGAMRRSRISEQQGENAMNANRARAMRNRMSVLEGVLNGLDGEGVPISYTMGVQPLARPVRSNVLMRGDVEMPAQQVARGFLQVLHHEETPSIAEDSIGRRELAEWISSKSNPLTARVMVNRIWMHLVGKPIVATPNNWGTTGQTPTHPELLDYLASRFMDSDWSIKTLVREIVLSATYQRSSRANVSNYSKDPENKWLWRASPRQIDAEAYRDSMLQVSGNLDLSRPLGSDLAKLGQGRVGRLPLDVNSAIARTHRSVYLPIVRNNVPEALALFDFADPAAPSAKREETNVPGQALYLLNSPFVIQQAKNMADELGKRYEKIENQIAHAFLQVYGRPAQSSEIAESKAFIASMASVQSAGTAEMSSPRPFDRRRPLPGGQRRGRFQRGGVQAATPAIPVDGLTLFCQSLLASGEFRTID